MPRHALAFLACLLAGLAQAADIRIATFNTESDEKADIGKDAVHHILEGQIKRHRLQFIVQERRVFSGIGSEVIFTAAEAGGRGDQVA